MVRHLKELHEIYQRCTEQVGALVKHGGKARAQDVSSFWADLFRGREESPSFNDFLRMRSGLTEHFGCDSGANAALKEAKASYYVMSQTVPKAFFTELRESPLGAPLCYENEGAVCSNGAIRNALTTYRVLHWLPPAPRAGRGYRILEIGAGYGQMAYQLRQFVDIEQYCIIDLPQNLLLSAFYLMANFPEEKSSFVGTDGHADPSAGLVFGIPAALKNLTGSFDLIVNSYSFQEMNLESVREYFAFARTHLAPNGIFYSLNSHRKAGVVRPSDYPVADFDFSSFAPVRRFPFQVFATNPYEIVLTNKTGAGGRNPLHLDALGELVQFGFYDEITEAGDRFCAGRLSEGESAWLEAAADFFADGPEEQKVQAIGKMRATGIWSPLVGSLEGVMRFMAGDVESALPKLESAISGLSTSFARGLCLLVKAHCSKSSRLTKDREDSLESAHKLLPHLREEIETLAADESAFRRGLESKLGWTRLS